MEGLDSPLTFGVEEEYFLVDEETNRVVSKATQLAGSVMALSDRVAPQVAENMHFEYYQTQIEFVTSVHMFLDDLTAEIEQNRLVASQAASEINCKLHATGTNLYPGLHERTDTPRYDQIARRLGATLAGRVAISGCHVHVGSFELPVAIQLCNYLRPWMPTIQALCSNSPYSEGIDTNYSSWRSMIARRFPGWGPPPVMRDEEHYHQIIRDMMAVGLCLSKSSSYWHVRPSATYPTVEVRVGDVCLTAQDAALCAALVRSLVGASLIDMHNDIPPLQVSPHVLDAAHWRASKEGLEGKALDIRRVQLEPAWDSVDRLVEYIEPVLQFHYDFETVVDSLDHLRFMGSGASRQRQAFEVGGLPAVADLVAL